MTLEEAEQIIGQMMAVQRELQEGQLRLLSAQDRTDRQLEKLSESTTTLNNAMLKLIDFVQNHEHRIRTLETDD